MKGNDVHQPWKGALRGLQVGPAGELETQAKAAHDLEASGRVCLAAHRY